MYTYVSSTLDLPTVINFLFLCNIHILDPSENHHVIREHPIYT